MLYRPSSLVIPGNVTLVSTFVASTFTPAMTALLVSVTRPVSVAVGPARTECGKSAMVQNITYSKRIERRVVIDGSKSFEFAEYAAEIAALYHGAALRGLSALLPNDSC